jgi:hypothetical protein
MITPIYPPDEIPLRKLASKYVQFLPRWLDIEDLLQEARLVGLRGSVPHFGFLECLRKTQRVRRYKDMKSGLPRWKEPIFTNIDETTIFDSEIPEEILLKKEWWAHVFTCVNTHRLDKRIPMIVRLLADGKTKREIAARLHIDPARLSNILQPWKRVVRAF